MLLLLVLVERLDERESHAPNAIATAATPSRAVSGNPVKGRGTPGVTGGGDDCCGTDDPGVVPGGEDEGGGSVVMGVGAVEDGTSTWTVICQTNPASLPLHLPGPERRVH